MTEILTESFCERCGTRYTFQTAAPQKGRMGRLRVLSKGLKNYVLSDETTFTDALSDARNDEEREVSSQQLEAFHKTFNFCMSCRQYTCPTCWNDGENRCLSCAPELDREILPAPFPDLDARAGLGADAPSRNEERAALAALSWPESDLAAEEAQGGADVEPAPVQIQPTPVEPAAKAPDVQVVPDAWPEVTQPEPPSVAAERPAAAAAGLVEMPTTTPRPAVTPTSPDERAAAAASQTADLLGRFRPGQSIDEALEEYEREQRLAAPQAAPASTPAPGEARPEPVAEPVAPPEPISEPAAPDLAAAAVAEPVAEPEPVAPPRPVVEPATPGLAAAASAAPTTEPQARPSRADDRVEVPVWRIVAPEEAPSAPAPPGAPAWPPAAPPASAPSPVWPPATPDPSGAPQWPSAATLPASIGPTTQAREAIWAESSRELVASAGGGVRSCVSCGLSLSATAHFCRRCGSRQD